MMIKFQDSDPSVFFASEISIALELGKQYDWIVEVWLFGSRARRMNKPHSDIDLLVLGDFEPPETEEQNLTVSRFLRQKLNRSVIIWGGSPGQEKSDAIDITVIPIKMYQDGVAFDMQRDAIKKDGVPLYFRKSWNRD